MTHTFALLHIGAQLSWTQYTVHWSTVIGLMALGTLYAWRAHAHPGPIGRKRPALFASGLVLMFFSLNGWIHDLSDYYLFSAHMVQHLLLAMGVAPLLIMGTPGWMLRPALRVPAIRALALPLKSAIACFAIFNLVLIGWHLPPLYNAAMTYHEVHIVSICSCSPRR